jgi:predicted CoA-binding protein
VSLREVQEQRVFNKYFLCFSTIPRQLKMFWIKLVMKKNVAILGASDHPERYSHKAQLLLLKKGYNPVLITPSHSIIDGIKCYPSLNNIEEDIHTLTIYVSPEISSKIKKDILNFKCKRVIFNPGSENSSLYGDLKKKGIEIEEACTLVLLNTDQF